jgi:signal transduction histidine kinase
MGRYRYRQLFLFLLALIFPSSAIIGLGWLTIAQERELSEKRAADAQKQMLADIRQDLHAQLDRIKLQEITAAYSDPAVILVGSVEDNRLVLPWDKDVNADRFRQALSEPEFADRLALAERSEIIEKRYDQAANLYRDLLKSAHNPSHTVYSRFLLARVLLKSGRQSEAFEIYQNLLSLPSTIEDDNGIPFAFYAAKALEDAGRGNAEVLARAAKDLESFQTLSPARAYWLKAIVGETNTKLAEIIHSMDQAVALQTDFASLQITPSEWQVYGSGPSESWLIGLSPARANSLPSVIVVRAADVFRRVELDRSSRNSSPGFRIVAGEAGESLGESLPGLRVHFTSTANAETGVGAGLQRSFYVVSLVLVLGLTAVGGYLVWRDVRRELRVAELRSQFVSSVSHELKTPLTSIRMFAETLQMRGLADPKIHSEYLDTIVNESERLTRLLNNVLDFSRIERGQKTYQMQSTPLTDVIDACVHTMQYPLAEQGFRLRVSIAEDIPPIEADRDALEQAILNLLTNAMKYSGKSRDIDLSVSRQNGSAVIQVADYGIGIPAKEHQRIFEKFYRAPGPENRAIPGTGLGLALVDHIAKAHGGNVDVASSPGQGSTFSIRLPISAEGCA